MLLDAVAAEDVGAGCSGMLAQDADGVLGLAIGHERCAGGAIGFQADRAEGVGCGDVGVGDALEAGEVVLDFCAGRHGGLRSGVTEKVRLHSG